MSTMLETGRTPIVSRRRFSHQGLSPTVAPVTTLRGETGAEVRGPRPSPRWPGRRVAPSPAGRGSGSVMTRLPKTAATSRATPRWLRQSGRLLVTSRSMARSPPTSSVPSWFSPVRASCSASRSTGMSSRTYWVSQFQLTIMIGFQVKVSLVIHSRNVGQAVQPAPRVRRSQDAGTTSSRFSLDRTTRLDRHSDGSGSTCRICVERWYSRPSIS